MKSLFRSRGDECGASMVEYVLIITLVALALIAVISMFSDTLQRLFFRSSDNIYNPEGANVSVGVGGSSGSLTTSGSTVGDAPVTENATSSTASGSTASDPGGASGTYSQGPDGVPHYRPKDPRRMAIPNYTKDDLHALYGDEKAYQAEYQAQRWNMVIRYLILLIAIGVFIGLTITTTMRVRAMMKQMKHQ